MKPVEEIHRVLPSLCVWQGWDSAVKTDLSSAALRTAAGLVLVDPIHLAKEALAELLQWGGGGVAAIVLTNGNHERASAAFREITGAPVLASEEAGVEIECDLHSFLAEGDLVGGELEVIALPGAGPGEIALLSPADGGILCLGDTLINLGATGFTFLPDKYCVNPQLAKKSLNKLADFSFESMTFAHGMPVVRSASVRLQALMA